MCPHCIAAAGFMLVGLGSTSVLALTVKGSLLQVRNACGFGRRTSERKGA